MNTYNMDKMYESYAGSMEMMQRWLDESEQENSRLKEELEELKHKHYLIQGGRGNCKTYLLHLQQENKELKDNWNKIKQIIENERMSHWAPSPLFLTELLSKMQELEKSDSNEQGRI